ncbi:MAG: hypothetical protein NVSMB29_12510 [Candidatus Dormibacteria bacterium]
MSTMQAPMEVAAFPAIGRRSGGELLLSQPTRGYSVSRNPFTVPAVLPGVILAVLALGIALYAGADPVVACGAFIVTGVGLLLVPAVVLRGSLLVGHDGITLERGREHLTAAWEDIEGLRWNSLTGLNLVLRGQRQTLPTWKLPGGFHAVDGGTATIPMRLFGDRQYSVIYDIRDRVPQGAWMPAVEQASGRRTTRCLVIYAGVVLADLVALAITYAILRG